MGANPTKVSLALALADGDLDLLTTGGQNVRTISVRFNDGAGHFAPGPVERLFGVSNLVCQPALGDIDGDGDLDLIIQKILHLNDGNGYFTPSQTLPAIAYDTTSEVMSDVDGDGDLDLIDLRSTSVIVHFNNGQGVFTAGTPNTFGVLYGGFESMAAGDLDADGDVDLFLVGLLNNTTVTMLNNGQGAFATGQSLTLPAGNVLVLPTLGDLDGDGDLDVLYSASRGLVAWFSGGQALATAASAAGTARPVAYPNPAHGQLTLAVPAEMRPATGATPVRLYNAVGQLVLEQLPRLSTTGEIKLSVAHLPAGVYLLHVTLKDIVSTHRIEVY